MFEHELCILIRSLGHSRLHCYVTLVAMHSNICE